MLIVCRFCTTKQGYGQTHGPDDMSLLECADLSALCAPQPKRRRVAARQRGDHPGRIDAAPPISLLKRFPARICL